VPLAQPHKAMLRLAARARLSRGGHRSASASATRPEWRRRRTRVPPERQTALRP
jgi:hypothetical protein